MNSKTAISDSRIPKGSIPVVLLLVLLYSNGFGTCQCPDYGQIGLDSSRPSGSTSLRSLQECHRCRERIGIRMNSCNHPLLKHYRQKGINTLTALQFDILVWLQEQCFEFQEDFDHFANICSDPMLAITIEAGDADSPLAEYIELLAEQCGHMRDDLDDDTVGMKLQWTDWNIDNSKIPGSYEKPMSGRLFLKYGKVLLPTSLAGASLVFAYDYMLFTDRMPFVRMNSEGGQWLAVCGLLFLNAFAAVTPPVSIGLIGFGAYKERQVRRHEEEMNRIISQHGQFQPELSFTLMF